MVYDNHTTYWSDIRTSCSSSLISRWSVGRDAVIRLGGRTIMTNAFTTFRRHKESGLWTGVRTHTHSTSPIRIRRNSKTLGRCWMATAYSPRWAEWFWKRRIWLGFSNNHFWSPWPECWISVHFAACMLNNGVTWAIFSWSQRVATGGEEFARYVAHAKTAGSRRSAAPRDHRQLNFNIFL